MKVSAKIKKELCLLADEGIPLSELASQYDLSVSQVEQITGRRVAIVERAPEVNGVELVVNTSLVRRQLAHVAGFSDLCDRAMVDGVPLDTYVQGALIRMLEKVAGGMAPHVAAHRSGLSNEVLATVVRNTPRLKDMIMQAQHVTDMRSMNAVATQIERGDGGMALELLQRQTGDFRPAPKEIVVSGADAYKMAWGAIDAEFEEIRRVAGPAEADPASPGRSE